MVLGRGKTRLFDDADLVARPEEETKLKSDLIQSGESELTRTEKKQPAYVILSCQHWGAN